MDDLIQDCHSLLGSADYRPSYVEAAAKDGFRRCLDWFKEHGAI